MLLNEVVRVELVDQWWQQALPILALVVSIGSVMLTLWFRWQEGPRLRVTAGAGMVGMSPTRDVLIVELVNVSRQTSLTVSSVSLLPRRDRSFVYVTNLLPGLSTDLPVVIPPGEGRHVLFPMPDLLRGLAQEERPATQMRPVVKTSHRKFKGRRNRKLGKALQAKAEQMVAKNQKRADAWAQRNSR